MANLPIIYCIHASDAPQHLGKIQQFSQKFSEQKRIADFVSLPPEEANSLLREKAQETDLIILLLTLGLVSKQKEIENLLSQLKTERPNIIIAEIIIDNIQYENEYITLPTDLKPIRNRDDMDQAWLGIEKNLDDLVPKPFSSWKKYIKPAAALVVAGLLIWLVAKVFDSGPEPDFSFTVRDINNGRKVSDSSACYVPCLVSLISNSRNVDSVRWTINDTVTLKGANTDYPLLEAGKHKVELTAMKGDQKKPLTKTFLVKAAPSFEAGNDGCIAPCEINFTHPMANVKGFNWDFGDGTNSDSGTPSKKYSTPAEYKVTLTVTYEDELKKSTSKKVTTRQETSPFAQFTIVKGGALGEVPRDITFQNASQNADQYIWNFGDGTNGVTNAGSPSITHKYNTEGSYTVVLTAKQNNKESTAANAFYIGPLEKMIHWPIRDIKVLKTIDESPAIKARVMKEYRVVQP